MTTAHTRKYRVATYRDHNAYHEHDYISTSIDQAVEAFVNRVQDEPTASHYLDELYEPIEEGLMPNVRAVLGSHNGGTRTRLLGTAVIINFDAPRGQVGQSA